MLSARLDANAELEDTLTPRQRKLLSDVQPAGGTREAQRRHKGQRSNIKMERSGESEDGEVAKHFSSAREPLRRFDSVDSALQPSPPADKSILQRVRAPPSNAKREIYKDNRLGFGKGATKASLEEILGSYQDNQAALEQLQRDLKSKKGQATEDESTDPKTTESIYRHKIRETQMHGQDDATREKMRKILLVDPDKRTATQVKQLVEWTFDIDLLYGLTVRQRTQLCSTTMEAKEHKEGDVVLKMGDSFAGVQLLFEGKCAIYLDRTNNKANEATDTGDESPRAKTLHSIRGGGKQREQEREVSFSKHIEDSAKSRKHRGYTKKSCLLFIKRAPIDI